MRSNGPQLRIGTSGYQYKHWKEIFYPEGVPVRRWFEHYAGQFDTVEINNSFYHLPTESTFDSWRERAPDGFLYALKFSRFATHMKRLKDPEEPLELFVGRAERLQDHLGPILVQLPPRWEANIDRLAGFLEAAPKKHRWAIEFRDDSWLTDEVFALLRKHNAALCIHDLLPNHPWELTADWTYLRFHGGRRYNRPYSPEQLAKAAYSIRGFLRGGLDTFVYFNNDVGGHAFRNARELRKMLTESESAKAA